jgi:hypothetical protein
MKVASKNIRKKQATSSSSAAMNSSSKDKNNKNKRKTASVLDSQVPAAATRPKKNSKRASTVGATTSTSILESPYRAIDIVCGRGCGRFAKSSGNLAYRQLVESSRWRYEEAEKHTKVNISAEIVKLVKAQPGTPRFLRSNSTTKVWEELSFKKSVEKTSQTFRDLRGKPLISPTKEEEAAAAILTQLTAKGKKEEEVAPSTRDPNAQQGEAMHAMHYEEQQEEAEEHELIKKQDSKPKDESVPPKAFRIVKDTDILFEKHGSPLLTHPGSQAFFRIVRFNQAKYHSCAGVKSQQGELAQTIVTMIQSQGGRFREKKITLNGSKKSTWRNMPSAKAVQKTLQALYQLLSNPDSKPDSNDFLGLCSWLSGKSLWELQSQDDSARSEDGILMPRLTDVLIGRDHGCSQHPGNLAFRWMAHYNRTRYTSCLSRREKVNLIETIVAMMQHQGARLVEQNALTKAWCEIPNIKAVTETSLALRRAASQSLQPLEADFQEICQSIISGASSSSKVGNTSRLQQSLQHKSVVQEAEKEPIVYYSNEIFDEPSFPDGKEVPVVYADEVSFHTPVLEPRLTISVSSMLALEPAISLGQPTSLLSSISFSADTDGSLSLGPCLIKTPSWFTAAPVTLVNTPSWFTAAPVTSEPFGRQASSSHPAMRTTPQRESSQHVPLPLLTCLMSATTEKWVDALYFLPDEKFATKHHAPAALADHRNDTHNALDVPSPPTFVGTQSFIAVWDTEKDDRK